ncbi:O-antigen ligase family protein [Actinomadura gamaensis]|uniref:O-antigen ligase family protein n=1 Tax=Actinomadura gamaensis TaxID=1763541 RepID=A0ABV9TZU7_9ACTN
MIFALATLIVPARLVVKGTGISLTPADLVALAMGLTWLAAQFVRDSGAAKGRTAARTVVSFYVAAMFACYGAANSGYLPADERNLLDHSLVLSIAYAGAALAVCDGVRTLDRLDVLLKWVVAAGTGAAFVGALQYLFMFDLTKYMVIPLLRYTSGDNPTIVPRGGQLRVAATTGHPIEFGIVCTMVLPLAIHYALRARRAGGRAWPWWASAVLLLSGMLFSVSRSGVLTLLAIGFVLLAGWPPRMRTRALVVVAACSLGVLMIAGGLVRAIYNLFANAQADTSITARQHRYGQAAMEISKHPIFGRGDGTWHFPVYNAFDNQYIMSMVETGVLGTTALVLLFLGGIYSSLRARGKAFTDPDTRDLALSVTASLAAPLVGAVTFDLLAFATITGLTFLMVGASGALLRITREQALQATGPGRVRATGPRSDRATRPRSVGATAPRSVGATDPRSAVPLRPRPASRPGSTPPRAR